MRPWSLSLPIWAWGVLIIVVFVAIRAPTDALALIDGVGRLIGAIGDGVIKFINSFNLPH
jgi:hypothetical protein